MTKSDVTSGSESTDGNSVLPQTPKPADELLKSKKYEQKDNGTLEVHQDHPNEIFENQETQQAAEWANVSDEVKNGELPGQ